MLEATVMAARMLAAKLMGAMLLAAMQRHHDLPEWYCVSWMYLIDSTNETGNTCQFCARVCDLLHSAPYALDRSNCVGGAPQKVLGILPDVKITNPCRTLM
jgi:hypothetical protein